MRKSDLDVMIGGETLPTNQTVIYHLKNEIGDVVYVGQTVNLKGRLVSHMLNKEFSSFSFEICKSDSNDLEAIDIVKYNPVLNKVLPPNKLFISVEKIEECGLDVVYTNHVGLDYVIKIAQGIDDECTNK